MKNIWGPFLVVAPNSTLHQWQQELSKFCPDLKVGSRGAAVIDSCDIVNHRPVADLFWLIPQVLPYWGSIKERKIIRHYWNPKRLYKKESKLHVLITSYNVVVNDEKYFHRLQWQFMVLDEVGKQTNNTNKQNKQTTQTNKLTPIQSNPGPGDQELK